MDEGAGVAGGIAAIVVVGFVLLPALLVVALFTFFTILGMVHGTDFRASTVNLPILFAGIAVITAAFVVLILAGVEVLGRSLVPRRRRRA
jgi:hypothetical protein